MITIKKRILLCSLFFIIQIFSNTSSASLKEITKECVSDGITYTKMCHINKNNTLLHIVEIDTSKYQLDLCLAENQRDVVSDIAKRNNAIVAVNGANYRRGGPYNGCRLNFLYSQDALCFTGSFYAGAMIIDHKNKIVLDFCRANPNISIQTKSKKIEIKLDGINIPRTNNQNIMYDTSFKNRYIYIDENALVIKKTKDKLVCFTSKSQRIKISNTGFVVILGLDTISNLNPKDLIDVKFKMNLEFQSQHNCVKTVLCGAGMLLKNGTNCNIYKEFSNYQINNHYGDEAAADFGNPEQQTLLIESCHPRTAIGTKLNGNIILLVADGRSNTSAGLSVKELQDVLLQLECYDALNIGGGGCSNLVINNQLINSPSQGQERPVSEALCCFIRTKISQLSTMHYFLSKAASRPKTENTV